MSNSEEFVTMWPNKQQFPLNQVRPELVPLQPGFGNCKKKKKTVFIYLNKSKDDSLSVVTILG